MVLIEVMLMDLEDKGDNVDLMDNGHVKYVG